MQNAILFLSPELPAFKISFLSPSESVRNNGFISFQLIQPGLGKKSPQILFASETVAVPDFLYLKESLYK